MKFFIAAVLFGWGSMVFATPSPNDLWDCLRQSDPALMKDADISAGSTRPVLCHLMEYTDNELEIGLSVQAKFNCLMPDGTNQEISSGAQCRGATPPPTCK